MHVRECALWNCSESLEYICVDRLLRTQTSPANYKFIHGRTPVCRRGALTPTDGQKANGSEGITYGDGSHQKRGCVACLTAIAPSSPPPSLTLKLRQRARDVDAISAAFLKIQRFAYTIIQHTCLLLALLMPFSDE